MQTNHNQLASDLTTTPTREMAEQAAKKIDDFENYSATAKSGGRYNGFDEIVTTMARYILSQSQPTEPQCREFVERCFSRFQDCLVSESTTDIFGEQTKAALTAELSHLAGRSQGWRPIDEAPKDNGSRLVWCPEYKNTYVVVWGFDRASDKCRWMHFGAYQPLCDEPTHWQPLPPSPDAA